MYYAYSFNKVLCFPFLRKRRQMSVEKRSLKCSKNIKYKLENIFNIQLLFYNSSYLQRIYRGIQHKKTVKIIVLFGKGMLPPAELWVSLLRRHWGSLPRSSLRQEQDRQLNSRSSKKNKCEFVDLKREGNILLVSIIARRKLFRLQ